MAGTKQTNQLPASSGTRAPSELSFSDSCSTLGDDMRPGFGAVSPRAWGATNRRAASNNLIVGECFRNPLLCSLVTSLEVAWTYAKVPANAGLYRIGLSI